MPVAHFLPQALLAHPGPQTCRPEAGDTTLIGRFALCPRLWSLPGYDLTRATDSYICASSCGTLQIE